jgi:anaerobic magnesium-protoporphyrin IX monomethyl ester cyclase
MALSARWLAMSIRTIRLRDLILVQRSVRQTLQRLMAQFDPDLVGLSVMTFQRSTARRVIELLRYIKPHLRIVVGGYDPSLATPAYMESDVDYIVRGEGEITFRDLLRAIGQGANLAAIRGLSYKEHGRWHHHPDRSVHRAGE